MQGPFIKLNSLYINVLNITRVNVKVKYAYVHFQDDVIVVKKGPEWDALRNVLDSMSEDATPPKSTSGADAEPGRDFADRLYKEG